MTNIGVHNIGVSPPPNNDKYAYSQFSVPSPRYLAPFVEPTMVRLAQLRTRLHFIHHLDILLNNGQCHM